MVKQGNNRVTRVLSRPFKTGMVELLRPCKVLNGRERTSSYPFIPIHKYLFVDTIGNCQRLAFTVGISQHKHKKQPVKI